MFLHSNPAEDTDDPNISIHGHDLIIIKHSELDGLLASSICFQGDTPEVYFSRYKGAFPEEQLSVNSIWEILHENTLFQGLPFETSGHSKIILRHFNSGRLLCLDKKNQLHLEKISLDSTVPSEEPVVFAVEAIQNGLSKLYAKNSYKVSAWKDSSKILSHSQEFLTWKNLESNVKTVELEKEIMFSPLDDSYFDELRTVNFHDQEISSQIKSRT